MWLRRRTHTRSSKDTRPTRKLGQRDTSRQPPLEVTGYSPSVGCNAQGPFPKQAIVGEQQLYPTVSAAFLSSLCRSLLKALPFLMKERQSFYAWFGAVPTVAKPAARWGRRHACNLAELSPTRNASPSA